MSTKTEDRQQTMTLERSEAALPAVYENMRDEIENAPPATIAVLAASDVESARKTVRALQEASIASTFASDWVVFEARDGARLAYLQDAGCQRVRKLWGIDFAKFSPRTDLVETDLLDGNYSVEAYVEGFCKLTGETVQEIGWRSTAGLFAKAWDEARKSEDHVNLARIKADVRKSAIANAQGRIVRRATGLSQVPESMVCSVLAVKQGGLRGFKFNEGARGGSASSTGGASDAQINLIVGEAVRGKKVKGATDMQVIRQFVLDANLTLKAASGVIQQLKAAGTGTITSDQFLSMLGIGVSDEREPGEEG